ncbi:hypothetical protein ATE92_0235 [Ulvibacter sp. MAR_2010_11]|uniref:hypothetical protein n=1 Tax=Ulvibacter sp. MAR_2010_11 TaxID=1250229 RepID=UPI000C2CD2CF|nr:hypothetical protein [Ulvibacter sp. MAR_2010_11]PKA82110.1 hypothetical protein ATE92_0235 [Ulvibacter sp. MAR_2010_11]
MNSKLQKSIVNVFRILVVGYAMLAVFYFLKRPAGSGDEALFISDLQFIEAEGWIAAIKKGISIPYMLLAYPFSQFLESFIALRLVNVLLFLGLAAYFYKIRSVKLTNFYFLLLFFYSTVGYFLFGINDTLFAVTLVIFFSEVYFIIRSDKKENMALLLVALLLALFTRALFIVFIPAVLVALYFLFRSKNYNPKSLWLPVAVLVLLLCINIPSLQENGNLSYDMKDPPAGVEANWAQRQYHAQLLVNEGKLNNYNHPTWTETDAYLEKNGKESLPDDLISGMTFDIGLTLKEFCKDLFYIGMFSTRQLGLILPLILFLGFREIFKNRKITPESYIPLITLLMMLIFALIIISYVELRWLGSIFIMAILYYSISEKEKKISVQLSLVNYIFISGICLYGMYGFIQKLI